MNAEVARRRPAEILEAVPLPRVVDVRPIPRAPGRPPVPARRGTPADWPWYLWAPLLAAPGALLMLSLISALRML